MAIRLVDRSQSRYRFVMVPLFYALVLGVTGFLSGYLIPIWRTPYANQGPLLGIFFTGPFCVLIGLAIGFLVGSLKSPPPLAAALLVLLSAATVIWVYSICEPEDRWESDLVFGKITECLPLTSLLSEVQQNWERSIAINPQKTVLKSWKADVERTLRESPGHVAVFDVERTRGIYVSRHASNRDERYAKPWVSKRVSARYFVEGQDCPPTPNSAPATYLTDWPSWPEHERFPPDDAARLFTMPVLRPVPSQFRQWAAP